MRKLAPLLVGVIGLLLATGVPGGAVAAEPDAAQGPIVVTLAVGSEKYRIKLVETDDIDGAFRLLRGDPSAPRIPLGLVVRPDPDVNIGYHWHIDPLDFTGAEHTIELCDGAPSAVERGEVSGSYYCPWTAKVISIVPAR